MSGDIKLRKAQLKKNRSKVLPILGLNAASSAIDAGIQKKIYGSGTTTLIITNNEMNDVMKIVQALEGQGILLKGVTKTIKNETKQQKGGFLNMLMGTRGASLLGDILSKSLLKGKGVIRAGEEIKKNINSRKFFNAPFNRF